VLPLNNPLSARAHTHTHTHAHTHTHTHTNTHTQTHTHTHKNGDLIRPFIFKNSKVGKSKRIQMYIPTKVNGVIKNEVVYVSFCLFVRNFSTLTSWTITHLCQNMWETKTRNKNMPSY
jgi:hypothetical protein